MAEPTDRPEPPESRAQRLNAERAPELEARMRAAARARAMGYQGLSEHDPGSPLPTAGREHGTEPEPPVYGRGR
jgi:hypothetical protein